MTKKIEFEKLLSELNEIVNNIDSNKITIDEALDKFKRGKDLIKILTNELKVIEQKIENIDEDISE